MDNKLVKSLMRKLAWQAKKKTMYQILSSRCRRDGLPEYGRFTRAEIKRIIYNANLNTRGLMGSFQDVNTLGSYQSTYLALLDLAIYRALLKENVERNYAVNLIGDMMWQAALNNQGIVPVIDPLRKMLRKFTTKNPLVILEKRLRDMMQYPYTEAVYKMKFHQEKGVMNMDIYACPVYDYYKQIGEEEINLCRKTWCTFDFSAAGYIVEGGQYTREHCLSDGDEMCDMRWFIKQ
jgi:hypothetical protein